ncbi:MAG: TetR family transcriptional regulator [Desulfatibacillum sp.]|nr:TetR family transcriptional regulator [Desulfatibacillum sp.]
MGRIPRIEYEGALYYVQALAETDLTGTQALAQSFLDLIDRMGERFSVTLFAYALLPGEYHLLLKTEQANLTRAFQWFSTAYSRRHNSLTRRQGPVFKGRYKAVIVEKRQSLLSLAHCIHQTSAGLSTNTDPASYAWSSYQAYAGDTRGPAALDISPVASMLEGCPYAKDFKDFLKSGHDPLAEILHGAFLGSAPWAEKLLTRARVPKPMNSHPAPPEQGVKKGPANIARAIDRVCAHIGIPKAVLLSRTRRRTHAKDLRDALIVHLFEQGQYASQEIAHGFGLTDSAVSHTVKAFRARQEAGESHPDQASGTVAKALLPNPDGDAGAPPEEVIASMERRIHNVSFVHGARGLNRSPSQEDKTQRMRRQLILSTLFCLHQHGYHGATLSRILDHAGVSRGAWRHHFESKTALVAAAAQAMYEGTARLARENAPLLARDPDPLMAMFDFIWVTFHQGWHRNVWLEFTVAARTDQRLRELIEPVTQGFFQIVAGLVTEHLESRDPENMPPALLMDLSLYLSRGMAIQSVVAGNEAHYKILRAAWGQLLRPYFRFFRDRGSGS